MKKNYYLNLTCGVLYRNAIWGTEEKSNSLVKIDINTGIIEYVSDLGSKASRPYSYNNIIEYGGKLILVPGTEEQIIVYDMISGELNSIKYDCNYCKEKFAKFISYELYNNVLYMFPYFMPFILKIYLDTMTVEYLSVGIVERGIWKENKGVFISSLLINHTVYLPCVEDNQMCIFDLEHETGQWLAIQNQSKNPGFLSVTHDGNTIYLTNKNHEITPFNMKMEVAGGNIPIKYDSIIQYHKGNIWIISLFKYGIFKYILQSGRMQTMEYPKEYRLNPTWGDSIQIVKNIIREEDKIYIVPRCSNMLTTIDLVEQKLDCKAIHINKTVSLLYLKSIRKKIDERKRIYESECELEDFIDLVNKEEKQFEQKKLDNCGETIFRVITEEM